MLPAIYIVTEERERERERERNGLDSWPVSHLSVIGHLMSAVRLSYPPAFLSRQVKEMNMDRGMGSLLPAEKLALDRSNYASCTYKVHLPRFIQTSEGHEHGQRNGQLDPSRKSSLDRSNYASCAYKMHRYLLGHRYCSYVE